ncbi:MAG: lipid-A-disaccharide synthase [Planctomycetota bacterium]|nr:lipid-A-disaccharide synthase [Planctomycetota bacterium]
MRIFFSVGEPSGDQHAAHLIEELRRRVPALEAIGLGGPLMENAGCRLLYRMTDLAVMGLTGVLPMLFTFWRLFREAKQTLAETRPDAVVLVDFPGFNWHVARAAKRLGIPVFYYMPPQLWAWAPWRIKKVRKYVDHVLSGLTFERDWYASRGIDVAYVGHPFFDEVADHPLDAKFLAERRESGAPDARPIRNVAVLPGSRHLEVTRNGPALVQVMRNLSERHPDVVFRAACYKELHRTLLRRMCDEAGVDLPIEFCVGKTPEIVELADCCLMVSGSVSLELLARRTPAVVIYKGGPLLSTLAKWLLTCKFITLPNLLADRLIMPEHYYSSDDAPIVAEITRQLDGWLSDPAVLAAKRREMEELASRTATTGATSRAAEAILSRLSVREASRIAA